MELDIFQIAAKAILGFAFKEAIGSLSKHEYVSKILQTVQNKTGIKLTSPPKEFKSLYAYTLIHFSFKKPHQILVFLQDEDVVQAFRSYFDNGNKYEFKSSIFQLVSDLQVGQELEGSPVNIQEDLDEFIKLFNQFVSQGRSPQEMQQDLKLDNISKNVETLTSKIQDVKEKDELSVQLFEENLNLTQERERLQEKVKTYENQMLLFEGQLESEITKAKELREKNLVLLALEKLKEIEKTKFNILNTKNQYKLLINMGICFLDCLNFEEGAKYFIKALRFNPADEDALSYCALGYRLIEQNEKSLENAKASLEIDPFNINAHIVVIGLTPVEELGELKTSLPQTVQEHSAILFAFARNYETNKHFLEAGNCLRAALKTSNEHVIISALATLILHEVSERNVLFNVISQADSKIVAALHEAVSLYTKAWEAVKDSELKTYYSHYIFNRGIAKKLLGDNEGAIQDFKVTLECDSNDSNAMRELGLLHLIKHDADKAISYFKNYLLLDPDSTLIKLILSEAYLVNNDPQNTIKTLTQIPFENLTEDELLSVYDLLSSAYIDEKDQLSLDQLINTMTKSSHSKIKYHLTLSRIFEFQGEVEKAKLALIDALPLMDKDDQADVYKLSRAFYYASMFDEAILTLKQIINEHQDNQLTYDLVNLYYQQKMFSKALEICKEIREKHGVIRKFALIEINIYSEISDKDEFIALLEIFEQEYPDDVFAKLGLIQGYYNADLKDKLNKYLGSQDYHKFTELKSKDGYRVSWHYINNGFIIEGLDLALKIREKYYKSEEAHSGYIVLLSQSSPITDDVIANVPDKVVIDSGVHLVDLDNGKNFFFLLVNQSSGLTEELLPDEQLFKKLLGASIGQVIELDNVGRKKSLKLIGILSKFDVAFKVSFQIIQDRYPDSQNLSIVNLSGDSSDAFRKEFIEFLPDEKEFDDFLESAFRLYATRRVPFASYFKILENSLPDVDPIKLYFSLLYRSNFTFPHSMIPNLEYHSAAQMIAMKSPIILDLTSLLMIFETSSQDLIASNFGDVFVAQSTLIYIRKFLDELDRSNIKSHGLMHMTAYGPKGRFFEPGDFDEEIKKFRSIYHWDKLKAVPSLALYELDERVRETYDSILPEAFLCTIAYAQQNNIPLLSEDPVLRELAKNEFSTNSFDVHAIIDSSYRLGKMSLDDYMEKSAHLIKLNYPIVLTQPILNFALDKSGFSSTSLYTKTIRLLSGKYLVKDYALGLLISTLKSIYYKVYLPVQREQLVSPLIMSFLSDRKVTKRLIRELFAEIDAEFSQLLILQKNEVKQIILACINSKNFSVIEFHDNSTLSSEPQTQEIDLDIDSLKTDTIEQNTTENVEGNFQSEGEDKGSI